MADSVAQACAIVDALAAFQLDVLNRINRKFLALQSLANLLEQLADLRSWIPDLTGLVPVADITLDTYNSLVAACPFLNLPAVGPTNPLQAAVQQAYANLYKLIQRSPHLRLGRIQDEMDKFQGSIIGAIGQASPFIHCLQTVCAAGAQARLSVSHLKDSKKQIGIFADNYAKNAGQVLSSTQQEKYSQAKSALAQLDSLGAGVNKDYVDAKAAVVKK